MAGDETAVLARAAPSGGARARHGTLRQRRGGQRRGSDEDDGRDGGGRDGRTRVRRILPGRRPFVSAFRVAVVDGDG